MRRSPETPARSTVFPETGLWYDATTSALLRGPDLPDLLRLAGDVSMGRTHTVALLLGAAGLMWHACARFPGAGEEGLTSGHVALAAALKDFRPVEPRLVGGFGQAPCRAVPSSRLIAERACSDMPPKDPADRAALRQARLQIEAEARTGASPAALHALAILELILDPDHSGRAAESLQNVVAAAPGDARAWSDLAAAWLVRAQRLGEPRDLVRALEAAERAVLLDGDLPEARFNRALAAEALFLPLAREHWKECADRTPERRWRDEARERSRPPEDRGEPASLQGERERAEKLLLGVWAEQGSAASGALARSRAIGEALAARSGESLLLDGVAAIDDARRMGDEARLAALAAGHRAFARGLRFYEVGEWGKAVAELAASRAAFETADSSFAALARFYEACCLYLLGRTTEASAAFDRLASELPERRYLALRGHVAWMQGVLKVDRHDPAASLPYYETALASFQRLGEPGYVARVQGLLAGAYRLIGRERDAWEHAFQALRESRRLDKAQGRYLVLATAADTALAEGRLAAALAFQENAVREAGRALPGEARVDALFWRGVMRARAGQTGPAREDLQSARRHLPKVSDPASRRRMSADVGMAEGELFLRDRPDRAVAALSESLKHYEASGNRLLAVWVLRLRAKAFRRLGRLDLAEADLRSALAAYERLGDGTEVGLQLAFVARTEEAFDEMIAFQALDRRRPDEAFRFVDLGQTRVLPGLAARSRAGSLDAAGRRQLLAAERQPLGLDGVRSRLPAGTTLIQYSLLPDRLLIWRVRPDGVLFFQQPVPARELQRKIARLRSAAGSPGAWERESAALYDLLVLPWRRGIADGETVVLILDKALNAVPFAALQEPRTGRFLIQDLRIAVSPSATLAVSGPSPVQTPAAGRIPALVVGNPAFDRGQWSELRDLPRAGEEAAEVARSVPGSAFLRGEEATRAAFLALARRADLLHFAGHAVADPADPLLSQLLLASPRAGAPGAVYAWEVYGMSLAGTRLVVLAACNSADLSLGSGDVAASLARAFLAAGVPRVVASLWAVDDTAAARLFQDFYLHPQARADPVGALRAAQISLLEAPEQPVAPWQWGAFQVIATGL